MIENLIKQEIATWGMIGHPAFMQKFVLENGREFGKAVKPKKLGKPKLCFMNAYHHALDNDLEYVEGYVMIPGIPFLIHHAWCCETGDNTPIEVTIKKCEDHEYFGIEFDMYTVEKELAKNGVYGILDTGHGINVDLMKRMGMEIGYG